MVTSSIASSLVVVKRAMYTQPRRSRQPLRHQDGEVTWVHDQIFAAGGDHIPDTWQEFSRQTGIEAVLHLRPGLPATFQGVPPRSFLWIDLSGEDQVDDPTRWLAACFLRESMGHGQAVLIHSSLGRHRGRWAFVAYRIVTGRSAQTALQEAAQRPWMSPYHTDPTAWEEFEKRVRAGEMEGVVHALRPGRICRD
jgi:hypothetical protein